MLISCASDEICTKIYEWRSQLVDSSFLEGYLGSDPGGTTMQNVPCCLADHYCGEHGNQSPTRPPSSPQTPAFLFHPSSVSLCCSKIISAAFSVFNQKNQGVLLVHSGKYGYGYGAFADQSLQSHRHIPAILLRSFHCPVVLFYT